MKKVFLVIEVEDENVHSSKGEVMGVFEFEQDAMDMRFELQCSQSSMLIGYNVVEFKVQ